MESSHSKLFVALCDYDKITTTDISFKKHDYFEMLDYQKDWSLAMSMNTGQKGYIPSSYVQEVKTLEDEPWYFGEMTKRHVEELLLNPSNNHGSFLVARADKNWQGDFALSVRITDSVKHYRIRQLGQNGFMVADRIFQTLQEAILHFQNDAHGIGTILRKPSVSVRRRISPTDVARIQQVVHTGENGENWPASAADQAKDLHDFQKGWGEDSTDEGPLIGTCEICCSNQKSTVFLPCGHVFACYKCAKGCGASCPICRKKIELVQQLYFS